ncbi:MAG: alpha/beta hydrolase [Ferruginibacter sp.]
MQTLKEKNIDYKGASLHYTVNGTGSPVVLLHGFGEDSSVWHFQVTALQNDYMVIVPDLPGSGKSSFLDSESIRMEDYADCIKRILDEEVIEKCIMIGHSMGGYITLAFADKYTLSLTAFGLFHSSAYADDDEKVQVRKKAIDFIEKNGGPAFLKTSIPPLFFDAEKNEYDIEMLLEKSNNFTAKALIQYYQAMISRPDRTEFLKMTPLPVLFIIGQHDKAVPFNHGLEQAKMPGHSYVHILRNSGHMGMLEETVNSNKFLADFLKMIDLK